MNIVKTIDQYNEDYIYFCEPIKNNIMNDGYFIRIIYSSPLFVLNGVYLFINISYLSIEKYYNKFKCTFDTYLFKHIIDKIKIIEEGILKKVNINKVPQYKIYEQLKNGNIKFFSDTIEKINSSFLLKISGIWETDKDYGLTYKFTNI
jgi:hypothetical protein